jgi:hypothetical protein
MALALLVAGIAPVEDHREGAPNMALRHPLPLNRVLLFIHLSRNGSKNRI